MYTNIYICMYDTHIYITITLCSGYACRVASKCLTLHCLLVFALYYKHLMNVGFFVGSCVCPTPSITNSQSAAPIIGPSMPHCSTNLPHLLGVLYIHTVIFSTRFRNKAMATWAAATQLVDQIQGINSEEWAWANNPQNSGRLQNLVTETKASMSQFHRQFMTEDLQKIKGKFGTSTITSELTALLSLDTEIKKIEALTKQLVKRHHT